MPVFIAWITLFKDCQSFVDDWCGLRCLALSKQDLGHLKIAPREICFDHAVRWIGGAHFMLDFLVEEGRLQRSIQIVVGNQYIGQGAVIVARLSRRGPLLGLSSDSLRNMSIPLPFGLSQRAERGRLQESRLRRLIGKKRC